MFVRSKLPGRVRMRVLRRAVLYTLFACAVVSMTIMWLYPIEEWRWELAVSNVLTVSLTMSLTYLIETKLEQISQLKETLQAMVERDRLTNVATRDFFFDRLEGDPSAYGASLMIDIDHFKRINDTFGHFVGDDVIKQVAQELRRHVREDDLVCRFGGEEFVVFLRAASGRHAWLIAERIRTSIEAVQTDTDAGPLRVTVSIGGSLKESLEGIEDAIKRADDCLYRAKTAGRNRSIVDWFSENGPGGRGDSAAPVSELAEAGLD